jgi:hypothetical protein
MFDDKKKIENLDYEADVLFYVRKRKKSPLNKWSSHSDAESRLEDFYQRGL